MFLLDQLWECSLPSWVLRLLRLKIPKLAEMSLENGGQKVKTEKDIPHISPA